MLSHLTDEQWQSHMEAFVDYQCSTGKYRNFTGLIPEWLESEGLPPSPAVNVGSGLQATSVEKWLVEKGEDPTHAEAIMELHRQLWTRVKEKRPHLADIADRKLKELR